MKRKPYKVIDCHCDTLTELHEGETLLNDRCTVNVSKLKAYDGYVQLFAAWLDDADKTPLKTVLKIIDRFYDELVIHKVSMVQILSATDFEKAFFEKKVGAMLTVENGACLEGEIANLRNLYRLGVRAMTLTWNGQNEIADGIGEGRGTGLSDFGKSVVYEMNKLGMMIDVSHLSEAGFFDVLALSEVPVMASHSNSRSIGSHMRNLTDEQIKQLAEKGGVTGLNLYPLFLSDSGKADLNVCLQHIEHIVNVGGEDCLVLGSDFDGFSTEPVTDLAGPEDYSKLFALLEKKGHSGTLIEKITHKNFIRFAKEVLR